MKKQLLLGSMALGMISILGTSCAKETTTYDDVKSIIDAKCATCHSGSTPAAGRDYTTYAGLKPVLTDATLFTKQVLDDKTMPKNGSLTSDEINKITAWKDNGYAE
ncbi:MAG: hypothetical protein GY810_20585 [Aureispira sp.]|nr:hypothetical protein [Aureispira sp.]